MATLETLPIEETGPAAVESLPFAERALTAHEIRELNRIAIPEFWKLVDVDLPGMEGAAGTTVDDYDIYNGVSCIGPDGEEITTIRIERANDPDYVARVVVCKEDAEGNLVKIPGTRELPAEDGAITLLSNGLYLVSGVEVAWGERKDGKEDRPCTYDTGVWIGPSLHNLTPDANARLPLKCNRFTELTGGATLKYLESQPDNPGTRPTHVETGEEIEPFTVVVTIRPQGISQVYDREGNLVDEDNGPGKEKYFVLPWWKVPQLSDPAFVTEMVRSAQYIGGHGVHAGMESWGGLTGADQLRDGWLLVSEHTANFDLIPKIAEDEEGSTEETGSETLKHYTGFVGAWDVYENRYVYLGPTLSIEDLVGMEHLAKFPELRLVVNGDSKAGGVVYPGSIRILSLEEDNGSMVFEQLFGVGDKKLIRVRFRIHAGPELDRIRSLYNEPSRKSLVKQVLAVAAVDGATTPSEAALA